MSFRTLLFAAILACPASTLAHQDDHPSQSGITHMVFVDMATVKSLGLDEPPRRDALFKMSLAESGTVENCALRMQKSLAVTGAKICERLQKAISWEQDLRRDKRKLVSKQRMKLNWPIRSSRTYLSDFGGALPINMNDWIHNSEIHTLNEYDTGETDFRLRLRITARGQVDACSTIDTILPPTFESLLCNQILSHAFWIPNINEAGLRITTEAILSARLIMGERGCRRGLIIGMDQRHGRMEIRSGPRGSLCSAGSF